MRSIVMIMAAMLLLSNCTTPQPAGGDLWHVVKGRV
jgi:hypothetical protein